MTRVCILTPDPASNSFGGRWREVFEVAATALAGEGVAVDGVTWSDAADLSGFDLVLPLTVWGYHADVERFDALMAEREASGVRVRNPASVLRWNARKTYLKTLAEAGAPAIPTVFVDALTQVDVTAAAERFNVERLVVKPQISAGAHRTLKIRPGDPLDDGPQGPAMIQPFLPEVSGDGELSLFYFGGRFSHAVRKVAKPGDFRVQPDHGGLITPLDPPADAKAAAEKVLAAVEEPLLYARVDLVRGLDGAPALIELELIEPDLYLPYAEDRGAAFARAVRIEAEKA